MFQILYPAHPHINKHYYIFFLETSPKHTLIAPISGTKPQISLKYIADTVENTPAAFFPASPHPIMSDRRQLSLDRDRVTVLLLINALLIKKAYSIYAGVLSNQQTFHLMLPQNRQAILEQFNNVNRRLQCNLGVLLYISDLYHNKAAAQQAGRFQFPVILSTPPEMPELRHLYKKLQDLYPEAIQFLKLKMQHMKQQQDSGMLAGGQPPMAMSKAQQLQQQMPILGNPQPKPSQPYPLQASPYNYDMSQMNSPQAFDTAMMGVLQLGRGQMGNQGKMYNPSHIQKEFSFNGLS